VREFAEVEPGEAADGLVGDEENGAGDAGGVHPAPDSARGGGERVGLCEAGIWCEALEGVGGCGGDEESVARTVEDDLLDGQVEAVVEELFN
jgi:hypothetical protein